MDNEIKTLIEAFIGYRDELEPVKQNLEAFVKAYESASGDILKLNEAMSGDIKGNLDRIARSLSEQADKAAALNEGIARFTAMGERYFSGAERLTQSMQKLSDRMDKLVETESRAEADLEKLEAMLEERRRAYDIKSLSDSLGRYTENVEKIGDFVDKSVAGAINDGNSRLKEILESEGRLMRELAAERKSVEELLAEYRETNKFLRLAVENGDVNTEYIYEILDKWALERKVKTKKK